MTLPVRSIVGFALTLALVAPVTAQQRRAPDAATTAAIRKLLDLTGAARLAVQSMEAVMPAQRAANPQIPAVFWDAFLAHARRDMPQLVDSLVPIYAAHYTRAELEELVRFYESPLGKRLSEVQPRITQESIAAGQRWGAAIGQFVGDSLARAGVKP